MRGLVALLSAFVLQAATLPVGSELQIRLTDAITTATAAANQPVHAVLIAPVLFGDNVVISAGASLIGTVVEARAANSIDRATLTVSFRDLTLGPRHVPVVARVMRVDNARETVEEGGRIVGILESETLSAQADRGINKLSQKYSGLAGLLQAAKTAMVKQADPQISYGPGVEMTVALEQPVSVPEGLSAGPALVPFPDENSLLQLAARQPVRAFSVNPPQPSDLTNLILIGDAALVQNAFEKAEWAPASALNDQSKLETVRAVMEDRGYKEGPVSLLTLAGRPPDMVFQKTNNTFAARHHIRIWRRPGTYAGQPIWVCTSTHDIGISFSEQERTFIHQIDSHVDIERAKVVTDLLYTGMVRSLALIDRPQAPRQSVNATQDELLTDGRIAAVLFTGTGL